MIKEHHDIEFEELASRFHSGWWCFDNIKDNRDIKLIKACEVIECYDRVVDTIDEDYFLDVICTTDEWRDLQNCVENNYLGCGCPKDIMPIVNDK